MKSFSFDNMVSVEAGSTFVYEQGGEPGFFPVIAFGFRSGGVWAVFSDYGLIKSALVSGETARHFIVDRDHKDHRRFVDLVVGDALKRAGVNLAAMSPFARDYIETQVSRVASIRIEERKNNAIVLGVLASCPGLADELAATLRDRVEEMEALAGQSDVAKTLEALDEVSFADEGEDKADA